MMFKQQCLSTQKCNKNEDKNISTYDNGDTSKPDTINFNESISFTGCYNPLIYCYMNARFRSGFIAILHRLPGFQKFFAKRLRGTNRYPNNGESIILALNHQSYINKVNKKSNRVVKNDDYFNDDDGINGTD